MTGSAGTELDSRVLPYQLCSTDVENEKGYAILHDIEIVGMWFLSVVTGMVLTMLRPRIVSESCGRGVTREQCGHTPASHELHEREGAMVLTEREV